jgi:hypothetical protein
VIYGPIGTNREALHCHYFNLISWQGNEFETRKTCTTITAEIVNMTNEILLKIEFDKILSTAERLFGSRDESYKIELKIEGDSTVTTKSEKTVEVKIPGYCLNDVEQGIFQLAHEAVHCLSPETIYIVPASVLEEGLATYFADVYSRQNRSKDYQIDDRYNEAFEIVKKFLGSDEEVIKKIRLHQPMISKIEAEDILQAMPTCPQEVAEELTKPFKY